MLKTIIRKQYQDKIDQTNQLTGFVRPKEGWIRTLRKALGMSGPQLAKRLKVGKSQMSQMERLEMDDRITLKQLRKVAHALDSELVYALVPKNPVNDMLWERACEKAKALVEKTDAQMKLESQQVSRDLLESFKEKEAERLVKEIPRDFWED
ncbi:MAG: mobile mystery protein A [Thiohalomonadales bacterium]